ncbi:MAG: HAMP domain-containing histidine kinase [Acidobacteriota bacterium]|nr:HAMP domain-containing histidine kinase [Acidobacteriota bacterium]
MAKSLSFLQEIRAHQATFEWELQTGSENGSGRTLCFDGCVVQDRLLILGAASSQELLGFLNELTGSPNEQINGVRRGLQEMSVKEAVAGRFQHDTYNQLARLNNELANAQRELVKQNFELERLNTLKNEFLGMAAHDLRTPIGHILAYSGFLREEAASVLTPEQMELVSVIQSSSEFMLRLIDDFLDVSSIESGHMRLERSMGDPGKLLEQNVALNAALAQKKHIRVGLQIEGTLPLLSFDEGKIAQVLNNLISNAVKFSLPGSAVEVRAAAADGGVRIEVRDEGPGIPEGERGKLFEPFVRTSVRSTAGERSTGLGLAIVRKIVEGHGGRIWVESQVGVGSVFIFTLPAETAME